MPYQRRYERNTPKYSSVEAYETRTDVDVLPLITTYGAYGLEADLTPVAWPKLHQLFTGGDPKVDLSFNRPDCLMVEEILRAPRDLLRQHPVELLVLGNLDKPTMDAWLSPVPGRKYTGTPKLILEFWEPWYVTRNTDRPMLKLVTTRWDNLGYPFSCISANATQVLGGVVNRKWLICSRILCQAKVGLDWPELPQEVICPTMANCLCQSAWFSVPQARSTLTPPAARYPHGLYARHAGYLHSNGPRLTTAFARRAMQWVGLETEMVSSSSRKSSCRSDPWHTVRSKIA
jgi:hypothetical protein